MSAASALSIVLAGLLVISASFSCTSSPGAGNASSSKPNTSLPPDHQDGPNAASVLATQTTTELPRRVKNFPSNRRSAEIDFLSFEFKRPYLGYEGPNFTELVGEPSAGVQYLATAQLFAEEAISTAKFELIDQDGQVLQLLHFFKQDNSLENAHFVGSAKIPERPFRITVSGMGVDGEPYRRVFERLFRPTKRPPAPPILPRLKRGDAKRITAALIELEKQALAKLEERAQKSPDGVIVMPRIEISNATHGSLISERGNKLGMLLSYDIRFSTDGDYAHSLQVFPFYHDVDMRGLIDLEVLSEEINPKPEPPSYATPQIHVDLNTLVKDGSHAWYKGGVVYHFTIKLVPNFVGQNADKTKFCVYEEQFQSNPKSLQLWQRMKQDTRPIAYRIFMHPLAWGGETEPFDPPKTYFDGFLKEGAVKCQPYKNINF
jgi:hypothetical protein